MAMIRYLQEPGYMRDLSFLFLLYFNEENILQGNDVQSDPKEVKSYQQLLENCPAIPEELRLFFFLKEKNLSFFTQYYYNEYSDRFISGEYDLRFVREMLNHYDQVVLQVLRFYFPEESQENLEKCKDSLITISDLIQKSSYENDIKISLYGFFVDPISVIRTLSDELLSKSFLLTAYYEKNYKKILQLQEEFDLNMLEEALQEVKNPHDFREYDTVYVSFCLLNYNLMYANYFHHECVLVLGMEYLSYIRSMINREELPSLEYLGLALGEKNRVKLVDFMMKHTEVTVRDIAQEFNLSVTNAYYHISLLAKSGMVISRNQGRAVLYRLDQHYFELMAKSFQNYANQLKGRG